MGGEARREVRDEAESRVRRLEAELEGLTRRAAAVRLLRDTLERHRGALRRRYVSPFADRIDELGRAVTATRSASASTTSCGSWTARRRGAPWPTTTSPRGRRSSSRC